jgi:hypothetical protein
LKVKPLGSDPDSLSVGAGEPEAVTVNEPAMPTVNVALFGLLMVGAEPTPAPDRLTSCGLSVALSVIFSTAVRAPVAGGEKVTLTEQEFPTANAFGDCGQSLLEIVKSLPFVPVIAKFVMNRSELPLLVTVTLWALLVVLTA